MTTEQRRRLLAIAADLIDPLEEEAGREGHTARALRVLASSPYAVISGRTMRYVQSVIDGEGEPQS